MIYDVPKKHMAVLTEDMGHENVSDMDMDSGYDSLINWSVFRYIGPIEDRLFIMIDSGSCLYDSLYTSSYQAQEDAVYDACGYDCARIVPLDEFGIA